MNLHLMCKATGSHDDIIQLFFYSEGAPLVENLYSPAFCQEQPPQGCLPQAAFLILLSDEVILKYGQGKFFCQMRASPTFCVVEEGCLL